MTASLLLSRHFNYSDDEVWHAEVAEAYVSGDELFIEYSATNNSGETASSGAFSVLSNTEVYQDGLELTYSDMDYPSGKVQDSTTVTLAISFTLNDSTSDVNVVVSQDSYSEDEVLANVT